MKRFLAGLLVSITAMSATLGNAAAAEGERIFMFVRDGSRDLDLMLKEEVGVMRRMLEDAGYTVDIATPADAPMVAGSATLEPTIMLKDVDLSSYAGVVLPCMAPARGFGVPEAVTELTRKAVALGLPIAASRGSVETLAEAGGLVDRRYAFASKVDLAERPEFAGGRFEGLGVVRDDNISTAGICPLAARSTGEADGTTELMVQFIASLAEAD